MGKAGIAVLIFLFASGIAWAQGVAPATQATPKRLPVGGNVMKAKLKNQVLPPYPLLAVQARIQGTVRLHAIVSTDGTIKQVEVVSGHPLLTQPALDAVRQWQYEPTLLNGEPVEVDTTIDVVFNLPPVDQSDAPDTQRTIAALDPDTVVDIRRFLDVTGARRIAPQVAAPIFDPIRTQLLRNLPPGPQSEKIASRFMEKIKTQIASDRFLDLVIPIYAKHFTREEIKTIVAFFESPIGQHYVQESGTMLSEAQAAASEFWQRVAMPQIIREMMEEFPELRQPKTEKN